MKPSENRALQSAAAAQLALSEKALRDAGHNVRIIHDSVLMLEPEVQTCLLCGSTGSATFPRGSHRYGDVMHLACGTQVVGPTVLIIGKQCQARRGET